MIQVGDATQPVDIQNNVDFTLGRGDPSDSNVAPHFDFASYGALEKGVSRVHAALRRGEGVLAVVDLESTNGTFLNGHRLAANQPHLVRDGDEIRLGELAFYVYFAAS
jgi:pSer/pThr/pTyr-binding forkhead associated (FHA) protein